MVKRIIIAKALFIGIMFFGVKAFAQNTSAVTINKTLEAIVKTCDSLILTAGYSRLGELADSALTITPPTDYKHLSAFYVFKANACEMSTASTATCFELYKKAVTFAQKNGDYKSATEAMIQMVPLSGTDPKGIAERDALVEIIKKVNDTTKDKQLKVTTLLFRSRYTLYLGNTGEALQLALDALTLQKNMLANKMATDSDIAQTLMIVIKAYTNMGQHDKIQFYLKEMRHYLTDYPIFFSFYYRLQAQEHFFLKKMPEANAYYDSLTLLSTQYNNADFWNDRLTVDLFFAKGYLKWGENDKAVLYANRANELGKVWVWDMSKGDINYVNGIIRFALKEYDSAIYFLKIAAPLLYSYNYTDLYLLTLEKTAASYAALNEWEAAYTYSSKYAKAMDSLAAINTQTIFAEAEEKYQNKEKQLQIANKNIELAAAHKQRLWLIGGLVLAGLIATLLVVIYRNKKRTADATDKQNKILGKLNNDLEEANQTKARLFGIISHDLRSPISQVYQFLKLQQMAPDRLDEAQRIKLSNKIQSATGSLLETMEDLLLWSKTQMNQFNTDMQPVVIKEVVDECLQLLQLNIEAKNMTITSELTSEVIVKSDPYFLQTILRNLLQNAIKASPENGTLWISFKDQSLTIENNGGHFSQQQYEEVLASKEDASSLSGLGLRLVAELSRKVNAQVTFASSQPEVTKAQIEFMM